MTRENRPSCEAFAYFRSMHMIIVKRLPTSFTGQAGVVSSTEKDTTAPPSSPEMVRFLTKPSVTMSMDRSVKARHSEERAATRRGPVVINVRSLVGHYYLGKGLQFNITRVGNVFKMQAAARTPGGPVSMGHLLFVSFSCNIVVMFSTRGQAPKRATPTPTPTPTGLVERIIRHWMHAS